MISASEKGKAVYCEMVVLQLILFCGLFALMVKIGVGDNALNGLYFYPAAVQERVFDLGLTDPDTVSRKRKRFMIPFVLILLAVLVIIIRYLNGIHEFFPAYRQALLFLLVMNWFDGIVIDRLWVGHDRFWVIPGTEDIPFVQSWKQVLIKRGILTFIWIVLAAVPAAIAALL